MSGEGVTTLRRRERKTVERLLGSVGIEPLLLPSWIGVESITGDVNVYCAVTADGDSECFILAMTMKWAHPSLKWRRCHLYVTRASSMRTIVTKTLVGD